MSRVHPLLPETRAVTARDLAWLALSLALVTAPHVEHAPWWTSVFALCLLGWRATMTLYGLRMPARWLPVALAVFGMAGIWLEYRTLFGRDAGIALLVLFAGLKLIEMRSHRDATVVVFLCYFLIITNFLFNQSIPTALLMCLALLVMTTAQVSFNAPQRAVGADARVAATVLLHAIPLAALLFILFPRIQGPLWRLPQDAYAGITGLSDAMSPGTLSQLSQSDAIAFRALFAGPVPQRHHLYWRGPVFWDYDGRTWRNGSARRLSEFELAGGEARYSYAVILEPHDRNWLFALETPQRLPPRAVLTGDAQVISFAPVRTRLRYEMVSLAGARFADEEVPDALRRALRLPPGFNPRARELAVTWRRDAGSDERIVLAALRYLSEGGFEYTLVPPLLGRHAVDEFLFSTRAGFCEHFASAFVFLMRAAGLPARVVTGYQGGELNPVDGHLTVRQADAHAWAEVYVPGRSWVRVDPTAAVAPVRVDAGLGDAIPQAGQVPLLLRSGIPDWVRSARNNWEALANQWNLWVLGYNTERQREFLNRLGMTDADWKELAATLLTSIAVVLALLVAWSLRGLKRADAVQNAWIAFCAKLERRGIARAPQEGPRDFAARASQQLPEERAAIDAVSDLYIALRYGPAAPANEISRLRRMVRGFSPA
jgi:transglutaminase-like putative cysteine protease